MKNEISSSGELESKGREWNTILSNVGPIIVTLTHKSQIGWMGGSYHCIFVYCYYSAD